jgi:uncharacterized protein (TIGR03435 family)
MDWPHRRCNRRSFSDLVDAAAVCSVISVRLMEDIAEALAHGVLDRLVVDRAGLTGKFDFRLTWTPDGSPPTESADAPPDLFTAIQRELGLKLESTKARVDVLVIGHAERLRRTR